MKATWALFALLLCLGAIAQVLVSCGETGDYDGDDDASIPVYPTDHLTQWNCYLCHEQDFLGATGEPHSGLFAAPEYCLACHDEGDEDYANPNAPDDHGSDENCLTCHEGRHGKTWEGPLQCFTCHERGTATSSPVGHNNSWDCYLCHAEDFLGSAGEPHNHQFDAPGDCVECHEQGTWTYTNPNAPDGHGSSSANCLNCHQGEHSKTWTDKAQCAVCHAPGTATSSPVGHNDSWDCYLCHAEDFLGSAGEPHDHQFDAPGDCVECHEQGTWTYTNPNAPDGHGSSSANCLNCHQGEHSKTWTDKAQCAVCHAPGTPGPHLSNLHEVAWDCYVCQQEQLQRRAARTPQPPVRRAGRLRGLPFNGLVRESPARLRAARRPPTVVELPELPQQPSWASVAGKRSVRVVPPILRCLVVRVGVAVWSV